MNTSIIPFQLKPKKNPLECGRYIPITNTYCTTTNTTVWKRASILCQSQAIFVELSCCNGVALLALSTHSKKVVSWIVTQTGLSVCMFYLCLLGFSVRRHAHYSCSPNMMTVISGLWGEFMSCQYFELGKSHTFLCWLALMMLYRHRGSHNIIISHSSR